MTDAAVRSEDIADAPGVSVDAPGVNAAADVPPDCASWYLVQIRPNAFHIAERNLARQGFAVFCPRQEETRRRAGRFVTVQAPLFPGYLFVSFDETSAPWRVINSTYGVSRLVSFGDRRPALAPHELVAGLMARCDAQGVLKPLQTLATGDAVQVISGPFSQFAATVEQFEPNKRVWILLELLGSATRMAVDVARLKRL